jgi:hypothetical protein
MVSGPACEIEINGVNVDRRASRFLPFVVMMKVKATD